MGPLVDVSATPEEISQRNHLHPQAILSLSQTCDPLYMEYVSYCPSAIIFSMTMSWNDAER